MASPKPKTRAQIIDRYAELDRQYRLWQPLEHEYEELKKQIKAFAAEDRKPAADPCEYNGKLFQVQLTACENESRIHVFQAFQKLGSLKFLQIAELGVQKLKAAWPTAEADGLITVEQTGGRKIKAVVALKAAA